MKTLVAEAVQLVENRRWDIDYYLPPEGIRAFPESVLCRVSDCATIGKAKRDPTREPETVFQYIDISSVDVDSGTIRNPQELTGEEAPSRARKLVRAYDIVLSTCRPTRGAIAVVPESLHGEVCSTGFSVVCANPGVNPYYLHYALRLPSTLEQFRKWSTGSSYPAILDEDVEKTVIPLPEAGTQDEIARVVLAAAVAREDRVRQAHRDFEGTLDTVTRSIAQGSAVPPVVDACSLPCTVEEIEARREELPLAEPDVARPRRTSDDNALTLLDL